MCQRILAFVEAGAYQPEAPASVFRGECSRWRFGLVWLARGRHRRGRSICQYPLAHPVKTGQSAGFHGEQPVAGAVVVNRRTTAGGFAPSTLRSDIGLSIFKRMTGEHVGQRLDLLRVRPLKVAYASQLARQVRAFGLLLDCQGEKNSGFKRAAELLGKMRHLLGITHVLCSFVWLPIARTQALKPGLLASKLACACRLPIFLREQCKPV